MKYLHGQTPLLGRVSISLIFVLGGYQALSRLQPLEGLKHIRPVANCP